MRKDKLQTGRKYSQNTTDKEIMSTIHKGAVKIIKKAQVIP